MASLMIIIIIIDFIVYILIIIRKKLISMSIISTSLTQPRSQVLSSPERKTLVGSGHVAPRFWVVTNKINMADGLKIDSCSYLA